MASDDEDGIFKVETVPPPEGESDVYNAPTRVGQLAGSLVEEIVLQARRQQEQSAQGGPVRSDAPSTPADEPAVIDPMKLRALEELAAREGAALRPPLVPTELEAHIQAGLVEARALEPAPLSAPPPPRELEGAARPQVQPEPPPVIASTASRSSEAPETEDPRPGGAVASVARPTRRISTFVLLALVLVLLAFGIYRLRR